MKVKADERQDQSTCSLVRSSIGRLARLGRSGSRNLAGVVRGRSGHRQRALFVLPSWPQVGRFPRKALAQPNNSVRDFTALRAGRHDNDFNSHSHAQRHDLSQVY